MVISDAQRLLFVHVQKTGGTTIDHALKQVLPDARHLPGMDRHVSLTKILATEPDLASYWSFALVRNPWARMSSWYRMIDRLRTEAAQGDQRCIALLAKNRFLTGVAETCPDFETFVMKGPDDWPRLSVPQVRYLTGQGRRVDLVGRQETLEADLRAVFARFELPWEPLTSINVDQGRPDYRDVYTEPMRRRIEEVFAKDLTAFGYTF